MAVALHDEAADIPKLRGLLVDPKQSLALRFRCLFALRDEGSDDAVAALCEGFKDPSALLKHEVAYVLGQMQNAAALPRLAVVLADKSEDVMVRHEAGEAIGAIGGVDYLPLLRELCNDSEEVVAETCQLAVQLLEWRDKQAQKEKNGEGEELSENPYFSVDPAPPSTTRSIDELRTTLCDKSLPLFTRYRAMFALRNDGSADAALAIAAAFDDASALFKHELAYVLGQMQNTAVTEALSERLKDSNEHYMVRHEAAEALGSIADDDTVKLLESHQHDPVLPVAQSCQVALDMAAFENSGAFQYAHAD